MKCVLLDSFTFKCMKIRFTITIITILYSSNSMTIKTGSNHESKAKNSHQTKII